MKTFEVKKTYNDIVKGKFNSDYEYNRWFKNEILKAGYEMEKKSLGFHFQEDNGFRKCLELGPGPGTWTKVLMKKYPNARIDLVDISNEMLKLAKKALSSFKNIQIEFFETDFIDFQSEEKYDFFFSSRAIEYFPDKGEAVHKILSLLKEGGQGFIITKTPKYMVNKILGRKLSALHKGQISAKIFENILRENNCRDIEFYPVAMSFPVLKSPKLNKLLHNIFYKKKLNFISNFFSESYCVKFVKK